MDQSTPLTLDRQEPIQRDFAVDTARSLDLTHNAWVRVAACGSSPKLTAFYFPPSITLSNLQDQHRTSFV